MKAIDEKSWIRIRNPVFGSKDPNPSQNVTEPEHCMPFMSATVVYESHQIGWGRLGLRVEPVVLRLQSVAEMFGLSPQLGLKPVSHTSEAFYLVLFFVRSVCFDLSALQKTFSPSPLVFPLFVFYFFL